MEKLSVLYSQYIIDGIPQELSPGEMLDDCLASGSEASHKTFEEPVMDETKDPSLQTGSYDNWKIQDYLAETVSHNGRTFPVVFAAQYTKILVERALIDTIWNDGHFRLGDVELKMDWKWDCDPIGNLAAFHASALAASECLEDLGIKLSSYSFEQSGTCQLGIKPSFVRGPHEEEDILVEMPYHTRHPRFSYKRKHPSHIIDDPDSWLIYVPMDSCDHRLGGSLLSETENIGGGVAPEAGDADYFFDCFEIVREMVEDGIIISGDTVGDGGLLTTLKKMCLASDSKVGARINLSDLIKACHEQDIVRLLFAEVPGVIIQIRDQDYDYLDAEFVLQDVMFFPLGHPTPGRSEIKVDSSGKTGIESILESLIRSQSSEGED